MTQRIRVGGPSPDFSTLSAAIASLVGPPLSVPVVMEVYSTTPEEAITIPPTVTPTASNPLVIMAFKGPFVASLFQGLTLDGGSGATYPAPQPRLQRPVMGFMDIQAGHVTLDGFEVDGDIALTANAGIVVNACLVVGGQIRAVRSLPATVDLRISNCEVRRCPSQSAIRAENVNGLKVYNNSALIRQQDQGAPNLCYALDVVNSQVDVRNNMLAGHGQDAFALHFRGDPSMSTFRYNSYFKYKGAKLFTFGTGGPETQVDLLNQWTPFMTSETGSIEVDPELREVDDTPNMDLNVSDTSPTMAAAPAIPGVDHDFLGERRPIDFVTMGANENSEVITDTGKQRFLELLSGLSASPVNYATLGNSGGSSLFNDFDAAHASDTIDELFSPIPIPEIFVPTPTGHEGLVVFKPQFQVIGAIYDQLANPTFDRADEVGLMSGDNTLFMIKRMHSIPFDAVGFLSTQFQIPIEIVT